MHVRYVGASIVFILISFIGFSAPLSNAFNGITNPIKVGLRYSAMSLKNTFSFYSGLKDIRNENIELREKLNNLESTIVDLKQISEENELLKDQLNVLKKESFNQTLVIANVMGNPGDLTGSTLLLDKGSKYGISEGDNVIRGNYIVGIARKTTEFTSEIELITSSNVSFTAYDIDSPQKAEGLAKGAHGSSLILDRILPDEEIKVGDAIVSSGKDGFFLPGFYIGKVTEIYAEASKPLKSASVETVLDFSRLNKVFVLVGDTSE